MVWHSAKVLVRKQVIHGCFDHGPDLVISHFLRTREFLQHLGAHILADLIRILPNLGVIPELLQVPVGPQLIQEYPDVTDLLTDQEAYLTARDALLEECSMKGIDLEIPSYKYQITSNDEVGLCRAGVETFEIDGDGNVYPCSFTFGRFSMGNLVQQSLASVLKSFQHFTINNPWCYSCRGRGGTGEKTKGYVPKLVTVAVPVPRQ
jgi:MoaA/NifB/PqqE/SkfB family radical SAM enzyme